MSPIVKSKLIAMIARIHFNTRVLKECRMKLTLCVKAQNNSVVTNKRHSLHSCLRQEKGFSCAVVSNIDDEG